MKVRKLQLVRKGAGMGRLVAPRGLLDIYLTNQMGLRPHSQAGEGELIWKRSQKPVRLLSAARLFK